MKIFKSTKGFTLVELVVVIAILGILAGVAVPAYSGYITKANDASDNTQLSAIKTAVQAAYAEYGAIEKIEVNTKDGAVDTIKTTGAEGSIVITDIYTEPTGDDVADEKKIVENFEMYYGKSKATLKGTYKGGAWWTAAGWSDEAPKTSETPETGGTGGTEGDATT